LSKTAKLWDVQEACRASLKSLTQTPFGPPTAFQVMHQMCKGACRKLRDHSARLAAVGAATGCDCATTLTRCPLRRADLLCDITGLCYDEEWYEAYTCAPAACGRFVSNERTYRAQRMLCGGGLYLDGVPAGAGLGAAAAAAAAAAAVALAWGGGGGGGGRG